jgi:adenine-specific DNA-methyltransferase
MSENGNKEMVDFFGNKIFSFPKPTTLVKYLYSIINDKNAFILDFFGGSGTTGQAVMELNKEDGGNRKFILVQIPEATDEKSEAFKAGFKKISDITIERNKRVVAKIENELAEKSKKKAGELQLDMVAEPAIDSQYQVSAPSPSGRRGGDLKFLNFKNQIFQELSLHLTLNYQSKKT